MLSVGRPDRSPTVGYLSAVKPALPYSAFSRAILVIEISLGHTASQAPVEVQLPNPSLSICAIISTTRVFRSGLPCGNNARCETLALRKSSAELFLQAATQAPQPIQAAAAKAVSALSFSIAMALASTAFPVFTEI